MHTGKLFKNGELENEHFQNGTAVFQRAKIAHVNKNLPSYSKAQIDEIERAKEWNHTKP